TCSTLDKGLTGNGPATQKCHELAKAFEINIRWECSTVMYPKSVIHRRGQRTRVPRRLHIHFGIAYQQRFSWRGTQFPQDRPCAYRIRLLRFKAISPVDSAKIL